MYTAVLLIGRKRCDEIGMKGVEEIVDLIRVRIVPLEMELNEFMRVVNRAETKEAALVGVVCGEVGNVNIYMKVFGLVKVVD